MVDDKAYAISKGTKGFLIIDNFETNICVFFNTWKQ